MVAISVDSPEKEEAVRRELNLPFPILSDSERKVVRAWDIYNPRENGGIAKPAVFILERDRTVRFLSVDHVASRIPAAEIMRRVLQQDASPAQRKTLVPGPATFVRAIRNGMSMGAKQEEKG